MLQHSFIQFSNKTTEVKLWKQGVLHWNELASANVAHRTKQDLQNKVEEWKSKINDHAFLSQKFTSSEQWRLFNDFKNSCCYLDIETTGLSRYNNIVTTIGCFNGKTSKVFVQGQNLHQFPKYIQQFSLIVTYNGKTFDMPFLKTQFPRIEFNQIHIDLRYPLAKLGFKGGLKKIERDVGIVRSDELAAVDGYEAVRLWYQYKRGDLDALELLKRYNIADVENLQPLMIQTFDSLKQQEFLRHIE